MSQERLMPQKMLEHFHHSSMAQQVLEASTSIRRWWWELGKSVGCLVLAEKVKEAGIEGREHIIGMEGKEVHDCSVFVPVFDVELGNEAACCFC